MKKIIRLGKTNLGMINCDVFCRVEIKQGNLSISGVEGPMSNGNACGSCGQIVMTRPKIVECAPGWTMGLVDEFFNLWDRWHLNNMRAGTREQEAEIEKHKAEYTGNDHYTWACDLLKKAGLYVVDASNYITAAGVHASKEYKYGSQWLREELPQDVINFMQSLPDTDKRPAWV